MTDRSNLQCKMTSLLSDSTVTFTQGHNFFKKKPHIHFRHFGTYKKKYYSALPQLSTKTKKGMVNGSFTNRGLAKILSNLTNLAVSLLAVTCVSEPQFFSQRCLRVLICLEGKAKRVLKSDLLACFHI